MTPTYRPDIDGLRAIAVLSVLFFHAGNTFFSGGYVGVDIFFVISGYLITSIIVRDIANNHFSITQFYERRFRRILPALSVVIIASLAAGSLLLSPTYLIDLGKSAIATAFFSSNFLFYYESGYFDSPAELKPLLHTWSLAVEEQYYIFFPLLLAMIAKVSSRHYFSWLLALGTASFIFSVIQTDSNASAAFYLIPARAWELFLGSLLALHVFPNAKNHIVREILTITGIGLIAYSVFFFTPETVFPGASAAIPTLGTALIIYSGIAGASLVSRFLSLQPIVFIGLISYSLYLWHWPVIVYTKHYLITEPSHLETSVMLLAIFILAILSWRYVETPFRKKQLLASRKNLLAASAIASFSIFLGGLIIVLEKGMPYRYEETITNNLITEDPQWDYWKTCENITERVRNNKELCDIGNPESEVSFIFWGDSHARALASGVDLSAKTNAVKGKIATQKACPPLLSIERPKRTYCHEFNQAVLGVISRSAEIKTVILAARWALSATGSRYKNEPGGHIHIKLIDMLASDGSKRSNPDLLEIGLHRTIDELHRLGKNVVLVDSVPEIGYEVPSSYFISEITGRDINAIISPTREEYAQRTKEVHAIFSNILTDKSISIVKPATYLCQENYCRAVDQNTPLYRDDDHLSTFGSKYISRAFDTIFREIAIKNHPHE